MLNKKLLGSASSPPSDPDFADVTLLLNGDGTNGAQNNTFLDSSTNNFTITRNGNVTQGSFSPYTAAAPYSTATKGGSGYFDGSSYLRTASNVSLGSTYTFEAWVYFNSVLTGANAENSLFGSGAANGVDFGYGGSTGTRWFMAIFGSGFTVESANTTIQLNTWYHVAWVKNSTTGTIYVNGVEVATGTYNPASVPTTELSIGSYGTVGTITGYISDARYVNGTALYTTTFTPPTAPLTAISGTALLANFTNAGIPDLAMQNNLETVADAQVSTSEKKYGTGSLAFDGTGDYLATSPNTALNFGTGDFTIEFWLYTTATATKFVFSQGGISVGRNGVVIGFNNSTSFYWLFGDGSNWVFERTPSATVSTNTWMHIAVVRDSGTARYYVNGVQIDSIANTTNLSQQTSNISYVGGNPDGSVLNGYMDDVRITTGLCRYPSGTTFTPPIAALPTF